MARLGTALSAALVTMTALGFCVFGASTAKCDDVFALIGEENGNLDKLDITTGAVTNIKSNGAQYWGLAHNADQTKVYGIIAASSTLSSLVTIDQNTGANTVIGSCGLFLTTVTNLGDGRLFGIDSTDNLYQINTATGNATLVGATGLPNLTGSWSNSLASNGTSLYYTLATGGSNASLYTLNPATGSATLVGPTGLSSIVGAAFAGPTFASGQLFGFTGNGQTVTINTSTGLATPLNNNGLTDIFGGVGIIATVPEPTTCTLLLMGAAGLLFSHRRSSRTNNLLL